MKYNININQVKCFEYGLNLQEGAFIDLFSKLSTWAEPIIIEGEVFYKCTAGKITQELPMISDKKDTMLRIIKKIVDKGLIDRVTYKNNSYYKLSKNGKEFILREKESQEKNPDLPMEKNPDPIESQEKNPDLPMEKNPDNNNTSLIIKNNISKDILQKNKITKSKDILQKNKITKKEECFIFFNILDEEDLKTIDIELLEELKNKSNNTKKIFNEIEGNNKYKQLLYKFFLHWIERAENGKQKWEFEKTFDLYLRWCKFKSNDLKFNFKNNKKGITVQA